MEGYWRFAVPVRFTVGPVCEVYSNIDQGWMLYHEIRFLLMIFNMSSELSGLATATTVGPLSKVLKPPSLKNGVLLYA